MADKEIAKAGVDKELATLDIILAAKVERTAIALKGYIQSRLAQGATREAVKADLLIDLEEGGRIFGEFKNAIRPTFFGSIGRFRDVGEVSETGILGKWRWIDIEINENPCPDCVERHNQVKTWTEWEEIGLPRTNATVCEQNCKCVLVPADITEMLPIKRGK